MRKQQIIVAICMAVLAVAAIYGRLQPQDGLLAFKVRGQNAYGYGTTSTESAGVVRSLLRDHPAVTRLVLKGMPGTQNADTNLGIARTIRRARLSTHVDSNSYIASGAVDLFLAGTKRTMDCGARIGVHSWSYSGANGQNFTPQTIGVDRRKRIQEKFLREMGIDPAFYVFTREAAGPDDIYILTGDDIARFGILTESRCRA